MKRQDRPLRVILLDRGLINPYSLGLADGLERIGVEVALAGPSNYNAGRKVTAVYPRVGVHGEKVRKLVESVVGVVRLVRLTLRVRPDILHFQWTEAHDYAFFRLLRPLTRARIVLTVHNPVPRKPGLRQGTMIRMADVLIVHGPQLRDEVVEGYGVPVERIAIVPHGNFEHAVVRYPREEARRRLELPADGPVFAFIGKLVARKGVETLADAFRIHCDAGRPGTLVIAGPAHEVDMADLHRRLGRHEERVRWYTDPISVPAETLDLAVSAATQVVLPFNEASQSGSLIYSMTHGRCVVTTSVGELPDTLKGHGLIVPPRDPVAMAGALELAVVDPERCDALGEAARTYALEELDWARLATLTVAAYSSSTDTAVNRSAPEPELEREPDPT